MGNWNYDPKSISFLVSPMSAKIDGKKLAGISEAIRDSSRYYGKEDYQEIANEWEKELEVILGVNIFANRALKARNVIDKLPILGEGHIWIYIPTVEEEAPDTQVSFTTTKDLLRIILPTIIAGILIPGLQVQTDKGNFPTGHWHYMYKRTKINLNKIISDLNKTNHYYESLRDLDPKEATKILWGSLVGT